VNSALSGVRGSGGREWAGRAGTSCGRGRAAGRPNRNSDAQRPELRAGHVAACLRANERTN